MKFCARSKYSILFKTLPVARTTLIRIYMHSTATRNIPAGFLFDILAPYRSRKRVDVSGIVTTSRALRSPLIVVSHISFMTL